MYQESKGEAFHHTLPHGDGGELEFAEVADKGDGDDSKGALQHSGEYGRPCNVPCLLALIPALSCQPPHFLHCYLLIANSFFNPFCYKLRPEYLYFFQAYQLQTNDGMSVGKG